VSQTPVTTDNVKAEINKQLFGYNAIKTAGSVTLGGIATLIGFFGFHLPKPVCAAIGSGTALATNVATDLVITPLWGFDACANRALKKINAGK